MSKTTYPTKYQITKLEKRVDEELDPIINLAELELKAVLADETEVAMTYLAKKIKADKVINNLQKALEQLEIAQRQAVSFFGKVKDVRLKEKLNYKFKENDRDSYYGYNRGIMPEDCREQLREWAQYLAQIEAEKTPEGKKVKELKLYKQSAINSVFECGVPEQLNIVLEKVLSGVGIVWNKTKALQITNERYN